MVVYSAPPLFATPLICHPHLLQLLVNPQSATMLFPPLICPPLPRTSPTILMPKRSILPLKSLIISPIYRYVRTSPNSLIVRQAIPNVLTWLINIQC